MLVNKKGFTLLEIIVVLLIISTISFVTINGIRKINTQLEINNICKLIGTKFNLGQNLAKLKNEKYELEFNKKIKLSSNSKTIYELDVNDTVEITSNFINNKITINEKGNISRAGTINVKKDNIEKSIVFSIGSGSYVIQ